jgi:hypothetical protein
MLSTGGTAAEFLATILVFEIGGPVGVESSIFGAVTLRLLSFVCMGTDRGFKAREVSVFVAGSSLSTSDFFDRGLAVLVRTNSAPTFVTLLCAVVDVGALDPFVAALAFVDPAFFGGILEGRGGKPEEG